jgi:hypothetical protein
MKTRIAVTLLVVVLLFALYALVGSGYFDQDFI